MSIKHLIEDEYKSWCNIRVNDLTVDGTFDLDQSELQTITANIVDMTVTPQPITIYYTKVGRLVTLIVPPFEILDANVKSGFGKIEYDEIQMSVVPILPGVKGPAYIYDGDGVQKLCSAAVSYRIEFSVGVDSAFSKAGSSIKSLYNIMFTYIAADV